VADKHLSSTSSSFQSIFQLCKGDELLDEPLEFLRSTYGRAGVPVANKLALKIGQQGHTLIGRQPQLSVVYLVCHGSSSLGSGN
jgi:hypothetical protein